MQESNERGVTTPPATDRRSCRDVDMLFRDVRVFDGRSAALSGPTAVLVRGNKIAAIGAGASPANPSVTIIDGHGRTLMPGLIDAHTHLMFETLPPEAGLTADLVFFTAAAVKGAGDMLMRGFTSVRDVGGPVYGLKRAIDMRLVPGPRIWPSGAFISQSGGHGTAACRVSTVDRRRGGKRGRSCAPLHFSHASPDCGTSRTGRA